ncbi:biliverdin-producing heme oxygenase [Luteolibacter sp. GHJ8]|uniref:Biliverdin-producing heme oxygenase n=1 Tax=Luteolibacter rhizosphaerae TaxID=2989719 RepID=A0ABT3G1Q2_9BACT|nr:biliverdin-producing heme oxygenase [Luteolibacter rhizosphaerae]MCW1913160.1 biliverdin-producing heme oxygenase [Luteolibacter rhizosphaerae]
MILKRLRHETRELHMALEERLPLLSPELSVGDYRALLRRFHGYYAPLEEGLVKAGRWREIGLDCPERLKVGALERDLAVLGDDSARIAALPRCANLPEVESLAGSLGCFYVIEGATLGGQIISRHLLQNLNLTPETGCAFFSGYGAETGSRWKAFGEILTNATREGDGDAIVASANRTFSTLSEWLFRNDFPPS